MSNLHKDKLFCCGSATNQSITAINFTLFPTIGYITLVVSSIGTGRYLI